MILIADSGSTKTDWCFISSAQEQYFQTVGMNPFTMDDKAFHDLFSGETWFSVIRNDIKELHFYGAGLINDAVKESFKFKMAPYFSSQTIIYLYDDLFGAARALFGTHEGIACILGTGSNSGYYSGHEIRDKIPSLGYILGDEGSGSFLGKIFVNKLFKREFSSEIMQLIPNEETFTMPYIINRVYKEPYANAYLASFTRFIKENIHLPELHQLVAESFGLFVEKNILKYPQSAQVPIGFVGSIAFQFSHILTEELQKHQLVAGPIVQSPLENLVLIHQQMVKL